MQHKFLVSILVIFAVSINSETYVKASGEEICLESKRKSSIRKIGRVIRKDEYGWTLDEREEGILTFPKRTFRPCKTNSFQKPQTAPSPARQQFDEVPQNRASEVKNQIPSSSESIERFGIYGSNTIGRKLMLELVRDYALTQQKRVSIADTSHGKQINLLNNKNKQVASIAVSARGSSSAFLFLQNGQAEIGMSSREISKSEQAALQKRFYLKDMKSSQNEHVIGLDGIVVLVNSANPVTTLSQDQISKIFSGQIRNWEQVGGAPGEINIYSRNNRSGTYQVFNQNILQPTGAFLRPEARRYASNQEVSAAVYADRLGIGFANYASLGKNKAIAIGSNCGLIQPPSAFSIQSEEYPLTRRLFLYTTRLNSSHAKGIIAYSQTEQAQTVVKRLGFIDQNVAHKQADFGIRLQPVSISATADRARVRSMEQELRNILSRSMRLSITLRFKTNSEELDSKAGNDIYRLSRYLENNNLTNRRIYILGFSDSIGSFTRNEQLSIRRAATVSRALRSIPYSKPLNSIVSRGFGEMKPVTCDQNAAEKARNRRVEIWISR